MSSSCVGVVRRRRETSWLVDWCRRVRGAGILDYEGRWFRWVGTSTAGRATHTRPRRTANKSPAAPASGSSRSGWHADAEVGPHQTREHGPVQSSAGGAVGEQYDGVRAARHHPQDGALPRDQTVLPSHTGPPSQSEPCPPEAPRVEPGVNPEPPQWWCATGASEGSLRCRSRQAQAVSRPSTAACWPPGRGCAVPTARRAPQPLRPHHGR